MQMESERREKVIWWLFASAIAALCLILGILQYSWISEVSIAERERMQASLRSSLQRLSRDFNSELSAALLALRPDGPPGDESKREAEYSKIYERWKESSPHRQLLKRMALAIPHGSDTEYQAQCGNGGGKEPPYDFFPPLRVHLHLLYYAAQSRIRLWLVSAGKLQVNYLVKNVKRTTRSPIIG